MVFLFMGITDDPCALIHDYASKFDNNESQ